MAKSRSKTSAVCDASPIIHLDELNCIALLDDFERILVPQVVQKEVLLHRPHAFEKLNQEIVEFVETIPADKVLSSLFRILSLDAGERAALAVLQNNPSCIFLTDDAAARLAGSKMGIRVHGTIGIVIRSIRRALMTPDSVIEILYNIPSNSSLYIKPALLQEAIDCIKYEYKIL